MSIMTMIHHVTRLTLGPLERKVRPNGERYFVRDIKLCVDSDPCRFAPQRLPDNHVTFTLFADAEAALQTLEEQEEDRLREQQYQEHLTDENNRSAVGDGQMALAASAPPPC